MAGFTLLETILSVGLLSVVVFGAMTAFGSVAKVSTPDPARDAAEWEMRRIVTLEAAAAKYTGPSALAVNPAPFHTSLPFAPGTPIPITVSAGAVTADGAAAISVTITYPHNGASATLSKTIPIVQKAPAPQATIAAPGLYADPSSTSTP